MRAACYLRISSDRSGEGLGVDRQRQDAHELIDRRGWTRVGEHLDNNRSAARGKQRPAFQGLLRAIAAGELDVVVAWNLDRLARNARDRLALIEACQQHRVIIALVRGSDIDCTTAAGRMTAGILGEVAQHEIDVKSERQISAVEQAVEQGRRVGGRRPFGYDQNGVTVRADEAAAICAGYADLLAGVSLSAIARAWTARGIATTQTRYKEGHEGEPGTWTRDAVRRILSNPRNIGVRTHKGEERSAAVWPAIVPEETFRAAQSVLRAPNRLSGGTGHAGRQLLTGLALCGLCGWPVHGGGASHGRPIYRCARSASREREPRSPDSAASPNEGGHHVNRLAQPCDDYVTEALLGYLRRPEFAKLFVRDEGPDRAALREESTVLWRRLNDLAVEFADGELTSGQLRAATDRMRTRIAAIETELAEAGQADVVEPFLTAANVDAEWERLGAVEHGGRDQQRAVIDRVMEIRLHAPGRGTRTFRPETVEITWRT